MQGYGVHGSYGRYKRAVRATELGWSYKTKYVYIQEDNDTYRHHNTQKYKGGNQCMIQFKKCATDRQESNNLGSEA